MNAAVSSAFKKVSWSRVTAVALLAIYAALSWNASLHKGPSFDEGEELAVGYNIWVNHDFRMEGANGDLMKRWATLPFLITHPRPNPTDNDYWRGAKAYRFGYEFLYENGNTPGWLLAQGRAMAILIGVATGVLVYLCASDLMGALGGIFALCLFTFSPNMLAFGGIVSTDMSVCLTMLGATWCIWRLLHKVTWGRLAASVVFLGLLGLAKTSVLAIFPIAAILVGVKLISGRPLEWQLGRTRTITSPKLQVGIFAGLVLVHAVVSWTMLWAHYDFRFHASPLPNDPAITFRVPKVTDPIDPAVATLMSWANDTHFLPEGYLEGMRALLTSNERRQAFMNGQWRIGGWTMFFPYTIWAKTSPALLLLAVVGFAGWFLARHPKILSAQHPLRISVPSFYEGIPYFIMLVVFLAVAMSQDVNIGHRHILPIYTVLYILSGGVMALLWKLGKKATRIMTAITLLWFIGESAWMYPDYLAYFSPLVGGPARGYTHLVDSSLDWGMNLPRVKTWLDENNPDNREQVFLAYFGTGSPDYYGIKANRLPSYPDWRPYDAYAYSPGLYIFSATLYESVYTQTFGPWNSEYEQRYQFCLREMQTYEEAQKDPAAHAQLLQLHPQNYWDNEYGSFEKLRFGRLCAWLRHHRPTPDANIGYSIVVFHLQQAELQLALFGPPPEINDDPL